MKTIAKRLCRLERAFAAADRKPRDYFRVVLRRLDRVPGLEDATCRRTWWPNGTVCENVVLGGSSDGHAVTDEELEEWVQGFPIGEEEGLRLRPLPTP
ncbi:MAG: hypothetical protein ABSH24_31350 [Bryobacteraceae bacterium]|jgi:hypothetical protein